MKNLLLLLFILFSVLASAQNSEKEKVSHVPGKTASELYKIAKSFARNRNNLYFSNGQKNAGWGIATGRKASDESKIMNAKSSVGIIEDNPDDFTVVARYAVRYEGGMMGCLRLLIVEGDMLIQAKDGKTRITFTNAFYNHYNLAHGSPENIYGNRCLQSGSIQDLINCDKCSGQKEKFFGFYYPTLDNVITEWENVLRQNLNNKTTEDDW